MKEDPESKPVEFFICGEDPKCKELNSKSDATEEEIRNLKCWQCLDPENAANLSFNVQGLFNWIRDVKNRCQKDENPLEFDHE